MRDNQEDLHKVLLTLWIAVFEQEILKLSCVSKKNDLGLDKFYNLQQHEEVTQAEDKRNSQRWLKDSIN